MLTIVSVMFCPDKNNFERFKNSITSVLNCGLVNKNVEKIIIDGYSNTKYKSKINKLIDSFKSSGPTVVLNFRENNIGKSSIVNENIPDTELVFYLDSDIIINNTTLQDLINFQKDYDVVVPDQLEDCRHYKLLFEGKEFVPTTCVDGIAGGAIMMKTRVLKKIKFNNKGPYGSDDIEFFEQVIKNNYKIIVCESSVIHPFDTNIDYYKWKLEMALSSYHINLSNEEIKKRIKDSISFWKKY
jgi:hypothetical protein